MIKLYETAVILQPKVNADGEVVEKAEIVVAPHAVLAADDAQAQLLAGREIPEEMIEKLDRLTVVVRPF